MQARVYDAQGFPRTIDLGNLLESPDFEIPPSHMSDGMLDIFSPAHRVEDVWRYTVVFDGTNPPVVSPIERSIERSHFADRPALDATVSGRVILLVLESPHKSEYDYDRSSGMMVPRAPAQGRGPVKAGGAIDQHLPKILAKLVPQPSGTFNLVIANPIQYLSSCGFYFATMNAPVRDAVWGKLWEVEALRRDFVARVSAYAPEVVVNCCTKKLAAPVKDALFSMAAEFDLYKSMHPARNWDKKQHAVPVERVV